MVSRSFPTLRLLIVLVVALPLIEIALFIAIGQTIGLLPTLCGVVLMAIVGGAILRREGLARLFEARRSMGRGELPARALADATLTSAAGALIAVPGYLSGLVGILLLVPPLRRVLYWLVARRFGPLPAGGAGATPRTIELESDQFRPR